MSYLVFDAVCPNCGFNEDDMFFDKNHKDDTPCPECGEPLLRLPPNINLDWDSLAMGDSASPEAIAHFDRKHRKRAEKEAKTKKEHGDYGPAAGA